MTIGTQPALDPVVEFLKLEAAVAWPHDEVKRAQFLCAVAARLADLEQGRVRAATSEDTRHQLARRVAAWEELYQQQGGRRTLIDAPGLDTLLTAFERARHDAAIAGRVLGFTIRMAKDPRVGTRASIKKAKMVVHRHLPDHVRTVLPLSRSLRPVSDAWSSHQSVAPYACAIEGHRARDARKGPNGGRQDPIPTQISEDQFTDVMRTAERLRIMAAQIVPHGRTEPIIPPGNMLELVFKFEPLPEEEIELLPLPDEYLVVGREKGG